MRWVLLFVVAAGLAGLAIWKLTEREPPPFEARIRTVAFDNIYGNVDRLPVHVTLDEGAEQGLTAACDAKTCTFKLPLTNDRHELVLSVEQNGRRSESTRVTVDTSDFR